MPVTWPSGMSLAKLREMVPEPEPTSRSFNCGLKFFMDCNLGSKKAALFSAVRISWRDACGGGAGLGGLGCDVLLLMVKVSKT